VLIFRELRVFHPHVVQSTHTFANLYAALAGRWLGALSLGALRSSVAYARKGNGVWFRWLVRAPSALVANSESAAEELRASRDLRPRHVYVLPNVVELPPQVERTSAPRGPIRFAFVGRLVETKRVDRFLEALVIARHLEPGIEGLVVGDGPERPTLEQQAAALGLIPRGVTFLGMRDDVASILSEADGLVLCSDEEGFPNVVLEAMAAGLPVVTTDAGDAARVVADGVTGFVVGRSPHGIAERLAHLAQNSGMRRTLGQAGRRRVESEFSMKGLASRYFEVYRDLALRRGDPHAGLWLETARGSSGQAGIQG
jgi:glycosyltransferase involved in cell wall biosynthesis